MFNEPSWAHAHARSRTHHTSLHILRQGKAHMRTSSATVEFHGRLLTNRSHTQRAASPLAIAKFHGRLFTNARVEPKGQLLAQSVHNSTISQQAATLTAIRCGQAGSDPKAGVPASPCPPADVGSASCPRASASIYSVVDATACVYEECNCAEAFTPVLYVRASPCGSRYQVENAAKCCSDPC